MGRVAASAELTPRVRAVEPGDASDVAALLQELGYPCSRDEAIERIAHFRDDPRQHLIDERRAASPTGQSQKRGVHGSSA